MSAASNNKHHARLLTPHHNRTCQCAAVPGSDSLFCCFAPIGAFGVRVGRRVSIASLCLRVVLVDTWAWLTASRPCFVACSAAGTLYGMLCCVWPTDKHQTAAV